MPEPLLQVNNLKMYFPVRSGIFLRQAGWVKAVDDVSFNIYPGETLGLVGESGCGKSTIGKSIVRLLKPTGGSILFNGQNIATLSQRKMRPLRPHIQMVFQDPAESLNQRQSIGQIVAEPFVIHRMGTPAERREWVRGLLDRVGLPDSAIDRFPFEFSGGQRQRIGIARALIVEPEFIIADEPISALDMSIRAQVLNLLRHIQKERNITYLFIAHDLSVMRYISDRIAVIHKGDIVELADAEELVTHAIHPYTRSLLSAIPMPSPRRERNKHLLVYDPSMHDYSKEAPQWRELRPNHFVLCSEAEAKQWLSEM